MKLNGKVEQGVSRGEEGRKLMALRLDIDLN